MKTLGILLSLLLMQYTELTLAQTLNTSDSQGHTKFTDQHVQVKKTAGLATATEATIIQYQATNTPSLSAATIEHAIQQRKVKNALDAHQKQQRYLSWEQQLMDKKRQITALKKQLAVAKKIRADDFIANAKGGVRLSQSYRDRVSGIDKKLTISEKKWLALRRNKPD